MMELFLLLAIVLLSDFDRPLAVTFWVVYPLSYISIPFNFRPLTV